MTGSDAETADWGGDDPQAVRSPAPTARWLLTRDDVRMSGEAGPAWRRAAETLAEPALWLGRGAMPARAGGVVFGVWAAPAPIDDPYVAMLLRIDGPGRVGGPRAAAVFFRGRSFETQAARVLSPGPDWFAGLDADGPGAEAAWLDAEPPLSRRLGGEASAAALRLLPPLRDELGQAGLAAGGLFGAEPAFAGGGEGAEDGGETGEAGRRIDPRPPGSVLGAGDDEPAFWRAVADFCGRLPAPMRGFVSAASGFDRSPDGVLIVRHGGGAAVGGPLEAGEQAFSALTAATPIEHPGDPARAGAALRRWLRDIEAPREARMIADYVLAEDLRPPPEPSGSRSRAALLRRAVAAADEGIVHAAVAEPLDAIGAARIAAFLAKEVGPGAETAWNAIRRTEPARFFWSALTLRNSEAVDGPPSSIHHGPIRSLRELERLCAFDRLAAGVLPEGAPTPLDGPAFLRRLKRVATLGADFLSDDPEALIGPDGQPAGWIDRLSGPLRDVEQQYRRKVDATLDTIVSAAEALGPDGAAAKGGSRTAITAWRAAAAALRSEPYAGGKPLDPVIAARRFGGRFADALDRGRGRGAAFWRRAYAQILLSWYAHSPADFSAEVNVLVGGFERGTPGMSAAVRLAQDVRDGGGARGSEGGRTLPPRRTTSGMGRIPATRPEFPERLSSRRRGPEPPADPAPETRRAPLRAAPGGEPAPRTPDAEPRRPALGGREASRSDAGRAAPPRDEPAVRAPRAPERPALGLRRTPPSSGGDGDGGPLNGSSGLAAPGGSPGGGAGPRARRTPPGLPEGLRQDIDLTEQRIAHWRERFGVRAGAALARPTRATGRKAEAVELSADRRLDLDERAMATLSVLARREYDESASPELLDDVAGRDVAWVVRQFMGLEFDPSTRAGAAPAPLSVQQGWQQLGRGAVEADLAHEATFFVFFTCKALQRSFSKGGKPERVAHAFKRFLDGPRTSFTIVERKISAPYPHWLRDHMFGLYENHSEALMNEFTDADVAARLDRALLFLSAMRVVRRDADRALGSDLWQPVAVTDDQMTLIDPPDKFAKRLERFFLASGQMQQLYADVFEKVVTRNHLYNARNLGHLSRVIRRWRNQQRTRS